MQSCKQNQAGIHDIILSRKTALRFFALCIITVINPFSLSHFQARMSAPNSNANSSASQPANERADSPKPE